MKIRYTINTSGDPGEKAGAPSSPSDIYKRISLKSIAGASTGEPDMKYFGITFSDNTQLWIVADKDGTRVTFCPVFKLKP